MATTSNPEKGSIHNESVENSKLVVTQPDQFKGLLETIALLDKISENVGGASSGDWSGSSGTAGTQQGDDGAAQSTRAQAIANLPDTPVVKEQLSQYIQKEIKVLRKDVRKEARRASKPGAAYRLNKVYAKMRRLNCLLSELTEASYEVLKRLYIKIFIDKQSVV